MKAALHDTPQNQSEWFCGVSCSAGQRKSGECGPPADRSSVLYRRAILGLLYWLEPAARPMLKVLHIRLFKYKNPPPQSDPLFQLVDVLHLEHVHELKKLMLRCECGETPKPKLLLTEGGGLLWVKVARSEARTRASTEHAMHHTLQAAAKAGGGRLPYFLPEVEGRRDSSGREGRSCENGGTKKHDPLTTMVFRDPDDDVLDDPVPRFLPVFNS